MKDKEFFLVLIKNKVIKNLKKSISERKKKVIMNTVISEIIFKKHNFKRCFFN
jgi:hypothetical protein